MELNGMQLLFLVVLPTLGAVGIFFGVLYLNKQHFIEELSSPILHDDPLWAQAQKEQVGTVPVWQIMWLAAMAVSPWLPPPLPMVPDETD